jgi:cysteine desulfurase / selenocysteine lyase
LDTIVPIPAVTAGLAALRREEFPWCEHTVYLNNAGTGPLPERTRLALEQFNRRRTEPFRLPDRDVFAMLDHSRALVGQLIGAEPEEIALSVNTGFGLSLAARALPLDPGDIVLGSDREFPANVYPWMRLGESGIVFERIPTTGAGWPDEERMLERLRDPRVRAVAISWVQFSNGYMVDLGRLSEVTRKAGVFLVVDAIQGVGQVPLDVRETPVDVLACGAQKWLLSPWGSGFTYVRRELITRLSPAVTGWMAFEGTDDFSRLTRYDDRLRGDARRFELVTLPYQEFAGMNVSLELILGVGVDRIREHVRGLHAPILDWARRTGAQVASPTDDHGSGILCIAPPAVDDVFRRLKAANIVCSLREGMIRLSPHFYNSLEDMERVVESLESEK